MPINTHRLSCIPTRVTAASTFTRSSTPATFVDTSARYPRSRRTYAQITTRLIARMGPRTSHLAPVSADPHLLAMIRYRYRPVRVAAIGACAFCIHGVHDAANGAHGVSALGTQQLMAAHGSTVAGITDHGSRHLRHTLLQVSTFLLQRAASRTQLKR